MVTDGPPSRPIALVWSIRFGIVGAVLLVSGLATTQEALVLLGVTAGVLSLVAVLIWRSQLISAWRCGRSGQADES